MEVKGFVISKSETIVVSEKFKKRELIVDVADNPQYPSPVKFEAVQDKVNLFDNISVGQQVEIFFNLNGREWTDKTGKLAYFTTLSVWRINKLEAGATPEYPAPVDISNNAPEDDDLPFN